MGSIVPLMSCGGTPSDPADGDEVSLTAFREFRPSTAEEDSFAAHRPESFECSSLAGWYLEEGVLEVDTGRCAYASLVEPTLRKVAAGARVTTEISYFDLTSAEPAEAHVALALGGEILFERTIAVPSSADVISIEVDLPRAVDEGELFEIHLHNHGQNTWNFSPLRLKDG